MWLLHSGIQSTRTIIFLSGFLDFLSWKKKKGEGYMYVCNNMGLDGDVVLSLCMAFITKGDDCGSVKQSVKKEF